MVTASAICGGAPAAPKTPWFWSDQYDLKLVTVGLSAGHDRQVLRGDPAQGSFSVCYLRGGELIAIDTVNNVKDQLAARKLIPGLRPDLTRLADASIPLKES
jgi:3-phenylpropionate/trans-cinnamate dioxygenase ferredoxin reductase subunit